MTDRRFALGLVLTTLWLLLMLGVLWWNIDQARAMKPNEWGDFFAGFVAPIAFLWLVLGYLQQGEELKASGTALEQQAEELRRSVEQQQALVEVTRQQVEAERETSAEARRREEAALKPLFAFKSDGGSFVGNGNSTYNLAIANAGATVTNVVAEFDESVVGTRTILDVPIFTRSQQARAGLSTVERFPTGGALLAVRYTDVLGREGQCTFRVTRLSTEDPHSMLKFVQVEA